MSLVLCTVHGALSSSNFRRTLRLPLYISLPPLDRLVFTSSSPPSYALTLSAPLSATASLSHAFRLIIVACLVPTLSLLSPFPPSPRRIDSSLLPPPPPSDFLSNEAALPQLLFSTLLKKEIVTSSSLTHFHSLLPSTPHSILLGFLAPSRPPSRPPPPPPPPAPLLLLFPTLGTRFLLTLSHFLLHSRPPLHSTYHRLSSPLPPLRPPPPPPSALPPLLRRVPEARPW